jgi:hypothetical protein
MSGLAIAVAVLSVQVPAAGAAPSAAPTLRNIASACPRGLPDDGFGDVAATNPHEHAIDCLTFWDVTTGASAARYFPQRPVTRAELATFVANVLDRTDRGLPASPDDAFRDDESQQTHEAGINALAAAGVVRGDADGAFNPARPVTRAQMATFLVNAVSYASNVVIDTQTDRFADDDDSVHEEHINGAAQLRLATGLPGGGYGGSRPLRRDQMGSFVARLLDLLVDARVLTHPQSLARAHLVWGEVAYA